MDIAIVITGIWCFGTLFLAIYDWNQVRMTEDKDLPIHKRRFESFSTNLSMIGVLGTFIGITWGLFVGLEWDVVEIKGTKDVDIFDVCHMNRYKYHSGIMY